MIVLQVDGVEFVDQASYLGVIKQRDEQSDQAYLLEALYKAALDELDDFAQEIVIAANKVAASDVICPRFEELGFGVGPGIRLKALSDLRARIVKRYGRVYERNAAGVALTDPDDSAKL